MADSKKYFALEKDGFVQGEWSIYERSDKGGEVVYEKYLFGTNWRTERCRKLPMNSKSVSKR